MPRRVLKAEQFWKLFWLSVEGRMGFMIPDEGRLVIFLLLNREVERECVFI